MIQKTKQLVGRPFRVAERALGRLIFERNLPAETSSWEQPAGLDDNPERTRYEPSPYLSVRRALRGMDITREHVFIDYGSGRGRVVLLAGRQPFARVMGMEIDEGLTHDARANGEALSGSLQCGAVEFVQADALTWTPPDDITHAYFYNPFSGKIFDAAVAALLASYDRVPRPLWIMYANPTMAAQLEATGRVRLVRRTGSRVRKVLEKQIAIYEVVPAP